MLGTVLGVVVLGVPPELLLKVFTKPEIEISTPNCGFKDRYDALEPGVGKTLL